MTKDFLIDGAGGITAIRTRLQTDAVEHVHVAGMERADVEDRHDRTITDPILP